jgi:hypothetical protein
MPTTNNNRKILDIKQWEYMTPAPAATVAGAMIASSRMFDQQQLYVSAVGVAHLYNPYEDGWVQIPSPGLIAAGVGPGACAVGSVYSLATTGSSTAGSTTSMTTNLTLARDLRGYSVLITSGSASGSVAQIARNTVGTNSVITFTTALSASIGVGSTYRLITPSYYVLGAGTLGAASFRRYDYALNTWSSLSTTGLPAAPGTDGKLVSTNSWQGSGFNSFSTGSATAATTNTLTNNTRSWTVNQWANSQIRITAGTGAGQIRTISSNTSTQVTVSVNWTVTPDTTSAYSIEGNDDFIYYLGNNAVTMYRYSITTNTWTTLSPGVARGGAPVAGMSANWAWKVSASDWNDDNSYLNGRFIYSFRGGAGALLDRYDIGLNTWAAVTYSPVTETFTTGTKYSYNGDHIYIQKDITGRWLRYNIVTSDQDGWGQFLFPNGAAILGDTAFDVTYTDGATSVPFIYMLLNTSTTLLRCMVI